MPNSCLDTTNLKKNMTNADEIEKTLKHLHDIAEAKKPVLRLVELEAKKEAEKYRIAELDRVKKTTSY